jgi:hypothetical protein
VSTWKSDFSEIQKITFSWRPDEAIFRRPKKSLFLSTWRNDFSGNEKIAIS